MKLTWATEAWYAWQEGDQKKLSSILSQNISSSLKGRIPSTKWGYASMSDYNEILYAIMLSNKWSVYKPLTLVKSTCWVFCRDGGPPSASKADFPYRDYVIIFN